MCSIIDRFWQKDVFRFFARLMYCRFNFKYKKTTDNCNILKKGKTTLPFFLLKP